MNPRTVLVLITVLLIPAAATPFVSQAAGATAPYLIKVKDYSFPNYINSNPQGRLNIEVSIYKLLYDGSSSYDWYFYEIRIQSVPGRIAFNSDWETSKTVAYHHPGAWWERPIDYDPTTTNGWSSKSFSLTIKLDKDGPGAAFTYQTTYPAAWMNVIDQSDYSQKRVQWTHDFNEAGDLDPPCCPSDSTFQARPWFVVKTTQDYGALTNADYCVEFGHRVWWWWEYWSTCGLGLAIDGYRKGDSA